MRSRNAGWPWVALTLALVLAGAGRAQTSGEGAGDGPPAAEGAPVGSSAAGGKPVGLDALLRLPSDPGAPVRPAAGNVDRQVWEQRFGDLRGALAEERAGLAESQAKLEEIARGTESWQMAAPGAKHDPDTSPLSFKLRSEIRDHREEISRLERRLRELDVEASLAGVPPEWRRPPHEDASPDS